MIKLVTIALWIAIVLSCPDQPFCRSCKTEDKDSTCTGCDNSFFDASTSQCNKTVPVVKNCLAYESKDGKVVCSDCEFGFTLDSTKLNCVRCNVPDCAVCTGSQECVACYSKMKMIQNPVTKSYYCSITEKCTTDSCEICKNGINGEECLKCSVGYAIDTLSKRCMKSPSNCKSMSSATGPKCLECDYGYYILADGSCKPSNPTSYLGLFVLLLIIVGAIGGFIAYDHWKKKTQRSIFQRVVGFSFFGKKRDDRLLG